MLSGDPLLESLESMGWFWTFVDGVFVSFKCLRPCVGLLCAWDDFLCFFACLLYEGAAALLFVEVLLSLLFLGALGL